MSIGAKHLVRYGTHPTIGDPPVVSLLASHTRSTLKLSTVKSAPPPYMNAWSDVWLARTPPRPSRARRLSRHRAVLLHDDTVAVGSLLSSDKPPIATPSGSHQEHRPNSAHACRKSPPRALKPRNRSRFTPITPVGYRQVHPNLDRLR